MFFSKENRFKRQIVRRVSKIHNNRYNDNVTYLTLKMLTLATFHPHKSSAYPSLIVENFSYFLYRMHTHISNGFSESMPSVEKIVLKHFIRNRISNYAISLISEFWSLDSELLKKNIDQRYDFYLRYFDPPTYYDFDIISFNIYKSTMSKDLSDFVRPDILELSAIDELLRIAYGEPYLKTLDGLIDPELSFAKLVFSLDRLDEDTRITLLNKLNATL